MASLKNELIGTWQLLSYIEVPVGGGDSSFPLGKSPRGYLLYNADGYMSVQISASDELRFASEDRMIATNDESFRRLRSYIAFSGKYVVDNQNATVTYLIETSLYPNWEGMKQVRKLDFDSNILYQRSMEPILSDGKMVNAHMTWQRVEKAPVSILKDELSRTEMSYN